MTNQRLVAEFLRAQAAWRLARAGDDPVRAARCAAALLDTAAFVAGLADDDRDLARLAHGGCFRGQVFDPGPAGLSLARDWQYRDARDRKQPGPRDLVAALAAAATRDGRLSADGRRGPGCGNFASSLFRCYRTQKVNR